MKIESITIRILKVPLTYRFETSFGGSFEKRTIIVEMDSEGIKGYGECPSLDEPLYSYETIDVDWLVLKEYMIPQILGRDIQHPNQLLSMLSKIRGYNMAKASLEEAFWDLFCKSKKESLSKSLGGTKEKVGVGVSIGIQKTIDQLLKKINNYLDEGYRRIKIKIKHGWDLDVVKSVRKAYPDIVLMVDANAAYKYDDIHLFRELDKYDLLMIEQPLSFNDLVKHSMLQQEIKTPICLDESIDSFSRAEEAIKLGSCKIVNIKPARVGGLIESKEIHDLCMQHKIPVWCGGMLETGIGAAHCVALASLPNFTLPGDISVHGLYSSEELVEPLFKLNKDGTLSVPKEPGIGVSIIEDELEKLTVKFREFRI